MDEVLEIAGAQMRQAGGFVVPVPFVPCSAAAGPGLAPGAEGRTPLKDPGFRSTANVDAWDPGTSARRGKGRASAPVRRAGALAGEVENIRKTRGHRPCEWS